MIKERFTIARRTVERRKNDFIITAGTVPVILGITAALLTAADRAAGAGITLGESKNLSIGISLGHEVDTPAALPWYTQHSNDKQSSLNFSPSLNVGSIDLNVIFDLAARPDHPDIDADINLTK